ncbi:MAG TPA: serine O-acetyltransferase [Candidatus Eremiobacteraceae bacterium]|nr:serine O-acetyltransferase [Candidatus Eremiobacteraceae bacterium]
MRHESFFQSIRRDWHACFERDPAARNWLEVLLCYPGFHAIFWHRLTHPLHRWGVPVLPRIMSQMTRFFTGIEIHPGAEIGSGFFIDHGMGVVIGETSDVGRDCTLYQGVTLGGTSLQRGKRHPTLEDGVVCGAGAKIIGAVVIGARSKIAAGAVVVKSVGPDSTVVGVPGRVVMQGGKRVEEPIIPQVDMPDPEVEDVAALTARIDALEARIRATEGQHGTTPL